MASRYRSPMGAHVRNNPCDFLCGTMPLLAAARIDLDHYP